MIIPRYMKGSTMKSIFAVVFLTLISSVAFASPAPEMDGALAGQVGLLITGVYLVAKANREK